MLANGLTQSWLAVASMQTVEWGKDMATSDFPLARIFLDSFVKRMERRAWGCLEGADEILNFS